MNRSLRDELGCGRLCGIRTAALWTLPSTLLWGIALLAPASLAAQDATRPLTLRESVALALESHPTVDRSRASLEVARAARSGVSADRIPALSAEGSATRFEEPMVVAPIHAFDPTDPPAFDETLLQGRLGLNWTLFDPARGPRIRAAEEHVAAGAAALLDVEAAVIAGTARAHLTLVAARAMASAADAQLRAVQAEAGRAQQFFDEGSAARVELLRARAALEDARAERARAAARVAAAEAGLAYWIGESVEGRPVTAPEPEMPGGSLEGGDGVGADHPELVRLEREVAAARASVAAARRTRLPTLSGAGGLVHYASSGGAGSTEWQTGVQLTLPIFTGGRTGARIAEAEARLASTTAQRDETDRRLALEADRARSILSEARVRVEALAASVARWDEVVRVERLALREGAGVQTDLLQAEASLYRAEAGLAAARADAAIARIGVARATAQLDRRWIENLPVGSSQENPR